MTRIRYNRDQEILFSKDFLVGEELGCVIIDANKLTYNIHHLNNMMISLKTGQANTLAKVKSKAKQALKELGVVFHDEIRNRGKTEKVVL